MQGIIFVSYRFIRKNVTFSFLYMGNAYFGFLELLLLPVTIFKKSDS
jgi:hypothetical protein